MDNDLMKTKLQKLPGDITLKTIASLSINF